MASYNWKENQATSPVRTTTVAPVTSRGLMSDVSIAKLNLTPTCNPIFPVDCSTYSDGLFPFSRCCRYVTHCKAQKGEVLVTNITKFTFVLPFSTDFYSWFMFRIAALTLFSTSICKNVRTIAEKFILAEDNFNINVFGCHNPWIVAN